MDEKLMDRVDHLMYKSGLLADGSWDQMDRYDKDCIEKLVHLVIQDCIDILEEGTKTQMTSQGGADRIKLHFGMVNE